MSTLRAGVYGRESKGKTASVEDQLDRGVEVCEDQDWTLAGSWRDGVGASAKSKGTRTGWPEVREAIRLRTIDILILWEGSRGSRDMSAWVDLLDSCRDHDVKIYIVSHERLYDPRKSHDRKTLIDEGNSAEYEVNKLSERVTRGVSKASREGKFHGRIPYGYQRVITGEERRERANGKIELVPVKEQRPDPETAPIAKEIITRVASNEPLRRIIRDLQSRGIHPPSGTKWQYESIHHIVKNPAYVGMRRHRPVNGGEEGLYPAKWEGIIPRPMWEAANAVLEDPKRRKAVAPGGLKYLLTVIMTAPCGGQMGSKKNGSVLRYSCNEDGCTSVVMAEADEWVTRLIVAKLSEPDARRMWVADDEVSKAAKVELAEYERQMKENDEAYKRGEITPRLAGIREAELTPLIEDARKRSRPSGTPLAVLQLLDAAEVGEKHVRPAWDKLTLPAKRAVVRFLFDRLVVTKAESRLSRWATESERINAVADRISHEFRNS